MEDLLVFHNNLQTGMASFLLFSPIIQHSTPGYLYVIISFFSSRLFSKKPGAIPMFHVEGPHIAMCLYCAHSISTNIFRLTSRQLEENETPYSKMKTARLSESLCHTWPNRDGTQVSGFLKPCPVVSGTPLSPSQIWILLTSNKVTEGISLSKK